MTNDLNALTREELDVKALDVGVTDPEKLPNKQAVIDAITTPSAALVVEPAPPNGP